MNGYERMCYRDKLAKHRRAVIFSFYTGSLVQINFKTKKTKQIVVVLKTLFWNNCEM